MQDKHGPEDAEDVARILGATGPELDELMRRRFGDWSSPPDDHSASTGFVRRASGLYVSEAEADTLNPLEHVLVYLTAEDIFGGEVSIGAIVEQVSKVSVELAVSWCASWVAKLQNPTLTQSQVDAEFIGTYLQGSHRSRVEELLRDPSRVLLAPQTFMVIMKIALEHCERHGPPTNDENVRPLIIATLTMPAHLSAEVEDIDGENWVIDQDAGELGLYFIANQLFNNPGDWRTAWAVYHRCLRELPRELAGHPRVLDFEAAYLDATGVPLEDLVTICAVIWARALNDPTLPMNHFDPLKWSSERLSAVLDLICATPETLRAELREDATDLGLIWSTKTFDRFPVVRWGTHLTAINPAWVVNRSTGLWPMFDVRRELAQRGESSKAAKIAGSVQHTHEHYALEIIEGLAGPARVFRDEAIRKAYGRHGRVADAAVDYGNAWVVVEVTTRGFQLKTVAGVSEDALGQDIDDIVDKARQVEKTIENIRVDERKLTGQPGVATHRRFFPVVVVASRFAGNPITFTMLRERLRAANVLQEADCAPLEVLELEDLHALEGATETYGLSLVQVLAEKAEIERPLVQMREFLAYKLGRFAPYPKRIDRGWKQWMDTALDALRRATPPGAEAGTSERDPT